MIFLFLFLLFPTDSCFAQTNKNSDDVIFRIFDEREEYRRSKQSEIETYEDLECTFWTPEIEQLNDSSFDLGFIFLPNNTVLTVHVVYRQVLEEIPNGGVYNIYDLSDICTYEIIDNKIIVCVGSPVMYFKDNLLYVGHDNINFRKYRLEQMFNNYIGFKYSQFPFLEKEN